MLRRELNAWPVLIFLATIYLAVALLITISQPFNWAWNVIAGAITALSGLFLTFVAGDVFHEERETQKPTKCAPSSEAN